MFNWFKRRRKYSEESVKYVLTRILEETIDRDSLRNFVNKKMINIVDKEFINEMYVGLNMNDNKADQSDLNRWMDALDIIEKSEKEKENEEIQSKDVQNQQ